MNSSKPSPFEFPGKVALAHIGVAPRQSVPGGDGKGGIVPPPLQRLAPLSTVDQDRVISPEIPAHIFLMSIHPSQIFIDIQ